MYFLRVGPLYLMVPRALVGPDRKILLSFLVVSFTLVDSVQLSPWLSYVYCAPPLLLFPYHRGHGRAVTFPLVAEGHGLACSSHGFLRLERVTVHITNDEGRIENADLLRVFRWCRLSCSPLFNWGVIISHYSPMLLMY